ncbi:MAG: hypothetical protein ACRDGH_12710 [Candidatus Limnocylindria bacterium]
MGLLSCTSQVVSVSERSSRREEGGERPSDGTTAVVADEIDPVELAPT